MDQEPNPIITVPKNMNENQESQKGLPVKTLILIVVLALIAFGLVAIALSGTKPTQQTQITQPVTEKPTLSDPIQTTLTASSNPTKLSTPSAFSTDIIINTGQDPVNKVQLEISYDPKILTKVDINPGSFFTDPKISLKTIDQQNGRISFALGIQDGETGILGQSVLATLSFTAIQKNATASVSLLPKTNVSADGYSESVLKSTIDAVINLKITPTISQSPTKTP